MCGLLPTGAPVVPGVEGAAAGVPACVRLDVDAPVRVPQLDRAVLRPRLERRVYSSCLAFKKIYGFFKF